MLKYSLVSLLFIGLSAANPAPSFDYGSSLYPQESPEPSSRFLNLYPNKPTPIFIPQNTIQNPIQNPFQESLQNAISPATIQNRDSNSLQKLFNKAPSTTIDPRLGGIANLLEVALNKPTPKPGPDNINELFATTLKKYDVKRYLLRKILGPNHESDESDGGFFSNQHLKRHGTAGVAGKVLGELIGIKIRESIDKLGKRFGEMAKDFTARNFVNAGNSFARIIKMSRF